MGFLAGERVTAARLNRLQPKTFIARASADLTGVVTDTDVTGATITLTTETNNAVYVAIAPAIADWNGAAGSTNFVRCKLSVDGAIQSAETQAEQAAGAAGDRIPGAQVWRGTLATAGSHTLKLVATINDADQRLLQEHTALQVTIYEVV